MLFYVENVSAFTAVQDMVSPNSIVIYVLGSLTLFGVYRLLNTEYAREYYDGWFFIQEHSTQKKFSNLFWIAMAILFTLSLLHHMVIRTEMIY